MPGIENRLEDRTTSYLPARISAGGNQYLGILCDISRSGARVQVNRPIEAGSEITIRLSNQVERTGIVRRCKPVPSGNKYDIGLELMMGTYWPAELLD